MDAGGEGGDINDGTKPRRPQQIQETGRPMTPAVARPHSRLKPGGLSICLPFCLSACLPACLLSSLPLWAEPALPLPRYSTKAASRPHAHARAHARARAHAHAHARARARADARADARARAHAHARARARAHARARAQLHRHSRQLISCSLSHSPRISIARQRHHALAQNTKR